jgi:large subunit ribosomal protein L15
VNLTDVMKSGRHGPARKRRGRGIGSGLGKRSGRGQKGAKARAGYHRISGRVTGPMLLMRLLPKRGFSNARFRVDVTCINVEDLNGFEAGREVGLEQLREAGLVKGRAQRLKVLGRGDLAKALTVRANAFSESAVRKIAEAGGKAEVLQG